MGDPRGLQRARRDFWEIPWGQKRGHPATHSARRRPGYYCRPGCAAGRGTVMSPTPTVWRPHAHSHPKTVLKGMGRGRGEKTLLCAPSGDSICPPAVGNEGSRASTVLKGLALQTSSPERSARSSDNTKPWGCLDKSHCKSPFVVVF